MSKILIWQLPRPWQNSVRKKIYYLLLGFILYLLVKVDLAEEACNYN